MRCHPQPSPAPDVGAVSGWYARWQRCPSGGNETERRCLRVLAGSAELSAPCHLASFSVPTGRSPVWMTVCAIVRSFTWVMISDGNEAAQHPEPFTWSDFFPQFFLQLRELAVKFCNSSGKGPGWDCSAFGGPLFRENDDRLEARPPPVRTGIDPAQFDSIGRKKKPRSEA